MQEITENRYIGSWLPKATPAPEGLDKNQFFNLNPNI